MDNETRKRLKEEVSRRIRLSRLINERASRSLDQDIERWINERNEHDARTLVRRELESTRM